MWFLKSKKGKLNDCDKLINEKKWLDAIECFDIYRKKNPKDILGLMGKGIALSHLKRYDEALNCYLEITEHDYMYESAWIAAAAAMYARLGRFDESILCNMRALLINSNNETAYIGIGVGYFECKKYDKSLEYFNKLLEINPDNEKGRKYKEMVLSKKEAIIE